jgi:hypothetical protein
LGIIIRKEPELKNPDMIVGWPGIGNIGKIAVEALCQAVKAEEFGEIEPWDYFYPNKIVIRGSVLTEMSFPSNKFYYKKLPSRDLLFFIGEEQPATSERVYAEGEQAFEMSNMVLDVAEKYKCRRVYTAGAAVALTHHNLRPRVWAVANREKLLREFRNYHNTMMMSEVEGRGRRGHITGLNGLLIGVAKKRGIDGVCLMGEIPDYLSRVPYPYPKASKAIIETFAEILGINLAPDILEDMIIQMEAVVSNVYQQFPQEIKDRLEQRTQMHQPKQSAITEDDEQWFKEHIDDFFKKEDSGQ